MKSKSYWVHILYGLNLIQNIILITVASEENLKMFLGFLVVQFAYIYSYYIQKRTLTIPIAIVNCTYFFIEILNRFIPNGISQGNEWIETTIVIVGIIITLIVLYYTYQIWKTGKWL